MLVCVTAWHGQAHACCTKPRRAATWGQGHATALLRVRASALPCGLTLSPHLVASAGGGLVERGRDPLCHADRALPLQPARKQRRPQHRQRHVLAARRRAGAPPASHLLWPLKRQPVHAGTGMRSSAASVSSSAPVPCGAAPLRCLLRRCPPVRCGRLHGRWALRRRARPARRCPRRAATCSRGCWWPTPASA